MKTSLATIPSSALRGTLVALLGILLLVWQRPTPGAIALLFGGVLVAWGAGAILLSLANRKPNRERPRWIVTLAEGIAGVAAGLFVLIWPQLGSVALVVILALWGVFGAASLAVRPEVRTTPLPLFLFGVAIGVGVSLLVMSSSAFLHTWFLGAYALYVGGLQLVFSLRGRHGTSQRAHPGEM